MQTLDKDKPESFLKLQTKHIKSLIYENENNCNKCHIIGYSYAEL